MLSMTCCFTTLQAPFSKDSAWATHWPNEVKALLKKFEQELLKKDWTTIRDGIEVKLCKMPQEEDAESTDDVTETFILCRSQDRKEKDKAIVQRAAEKIIERLESMKARCEKQNRSPLIVSREIGRLLGQSTRASHLFEINVLMKDKKFALIEWKKIKPATDWHELSDGCYLLRTNVTDWSDEDLSGFLRFGHSMRESIHSKNLLENIMRHTNRRLNSIKSRSKNQLPTRQSGVSFFHNSSPSYS